MNRLGATPFLMASILSLSAAWAQYETHVIAVPGVPMDIVEYIVEYVPATGTTSEFIRHNVRLENTTDTTIVAFVIGFLAFDAFNDFMPPPLNGFAATWVPRDGSTTLPLNWRHTPRSTFMFNTYGTGIAYVKTVRFDDGNIWRADLNAVADLLVELDFPLSTEDIAAD